MKTSRRTFLQSISVAGALSAAPSLHAKADKELRIPLRYQHAYPLANATWQDEGQFGYGHRTLEIPLAQAAFVMVDCWNLGWGPEPLARDMGWTPEMNPSVRAAARYKEVVDTHIAPVLEAARRVGMTVVHAPSPGVAKKYTLPDKYRVNPPPSVASAAWPPPAFVAQRKQQHLQDWRSEQWYDAHSQWCARGFMDIAPPLKPKTGELVVATGSELHAICSDRKILHLFYAGFALNYCVPFRDYGVYYMGHSSKGAHGYNCVLLRDCVAAIESHESYQQRTMESMFVQWYEMFFGYTTTGQDLVKACLATST